MTPLLQAYCDISNYRYYHPDLFSTNLIPGFCAGEEKKELGRHCSCMLQDLLVTCILLCCTKITVNFCLLLERPHYRAVTAVMSELTSQICKLKTDKLLSAIALPVNQEINKTGTSPHGICGVAVLVDQHIATNCLNHAQFYSFKYSTRINNVKACSSVNLEIQPNTNGLLTMSRISNTIFQKVRMAAFVHSLYSL